MILDMPFDKLEDHPYRIWDMEELTILQPAEAAARISQHTSCRRWPAACWTMDDFVYWTKQHFPSKAEAKRVWRDFKSKFKKAFALAL